MQVSQVLKNKAHILITAKPDEPIWGVLRRYRTNRIGTLVVTDDDGRLLGLLGEREILNGLITYGRKLLDEPVRVVMNTDAATCVADDSIDKVEEMMTSKRSRHIPVIEDDKVQGIISIGDLVKARLDAEKMENKVLRDMARVRR